MRAAVIALAVVLAAEAARADDTVFGEPAGGSDKALHFSGSALIAVSGYAASAAVLDEPWQRALVGAGVAAAAGLAKEGVDLLGFGTPSVVDLFYDAFGIMVGTGVALAFDATLADAE